MSRRVSRSAVKIRRGVTYCLRRVDVSTLVAEGEQLSLALSILACENIRFSSGYLYPDKPESKNNKRERDDRKKKLASSASIQIG